MLSIGARPATNVAIASLCLMGFLVRPAYAEDPTLAELAQKLAAVEKQNAELLARIQKLEAAQTAQAAVPAAAPAAAAVAVNPVSETAAWAANTAIWSYGEIGYNRPSKQLDQTSVDVQRAVIGIQHSFDSRTHMGAEFEWEHAVTSSDDQGEAEVEQLWVDHEFRNGVKGKAGLFLIPAGLINQNHEPTAYYGVFRNQVERVIIPSTWREVGVGFSGDTVASLTWDAGVTTGFNLNKWDPTSTEGFERGPLQSTHGEGQFAAARDLSVYAALNWRGIPGLQLGAFVFTGKVGQQQPGFLGNDSRLVLFDGHVRYQVGNWDLSALYARGTISNTEAINTFFVTTSSDTPTLIPHLFKGAYAQVAYRVWHSDVFSLNPFARFETYNTAAGFGDLSPALGGIAARDTKVWTVGTSFFVTDGVVFKADYQKNQTDSSLDGLNLGVGYSF